MSLDQTIVMSFSRPPNYTSGNYDSVEIIASSFAPNGSETGLPITFTSSNTTIAVITGNIISILKPGISIITANQAGNATYRPAQTSQFIKVFLEKQTETTLTTYDTPVNIQTTTSNDSVLNVQIQVTELSYTFNQGVAYGLDTGYTGVVSKFSITAKDQNNTPVTDHSSNPLQVQFYLPMSNPTSTLLIYKTDGIQILNVQPNGYPALLTYVDNYTWTATFVSLSDFVILDTNPPSGFSGGDPYIQNIYGDTILIPNEWKYVKLYEHEDVFVYAKCKLIEDVNYLKKLNSVKGLHMLPPDINIITEDQTCPLNKSHWWVFSITYMVELDVYYTNQLGLKIDLLHGNIIENKKIFPMERLKNPTGLYSLVHKRVWEKKNLIAYSIYLDNGNFLTVKIDNHWDDVNNISLHLANKANVSGYKGELFNHEEANNVERHTYSYNTIIPREQVSNVKVIC